MPKYCLKTYNAHFKNEGAIPGYEMQCLKNWMFIVVYFKLMCDHLFYCSQPRFTLLFVQYLITKFHYSCFSDAIQSLLLLLPVIESKSVTFQQKNRVLHRNFRHNWKVIKRISSNIKYTTGFSCAMYHAPLGCTHIFTKFCGHPTCRISTSLHHHRTVT